MKSEEKIRELIEFSGGDFSSLIKRNELNPITQNIQKRCNRSSKTVIQERGSDIAAHVVGLDGKTDGLSLLLRSIVRK